MQSKVSIGPASWLGWGAFLAGQIVFAVTAITGTKADLFGPGKWSSLGGFAALVGTNFGRQLQAALKKQGIAVELPSDAEELMPQEAPQYGAYPEPRPVAREASAVPDGAEQAPPPQQYAPPPQAPQPPPPAPPA
jgi:hypothetical protein